MIQVHRRAQVDQQRERREGDGPAWQGKIHELECRLEELRQQGNHEQAERVAQELDRPGSAAR